MGKPPMPWPAAQVAGAADCGRGVPLLVHADRDLVAKQGAEQDSWFVISHLQAGADTLDLLIHLIRLQPPQGDPFIQAIVSVIDPATGTYLAEEKVHTAAETHFSEERLDVQTPSGTISGSADAMVVTGTFTHVAVELTLRHQGPMLANVGNGLLPFYGDINYEYALPDMATSGVVTIDGKRYDVAGSSWFDRQWGLQAARFWTARQWSWIGISLDDGVRISLWDILDDGTEHAFATVLHPDGRHELVAVGPLAAGATDPWTSAATGFRYPTRWLVDIPALQATLAVVPRLREQEIVSPMGAHKYEAASTVSGTMMGRRVSGRGVVELVGDWK